jgi:hypothetical protein
MDAKSPRFMSGNDEADVLSCFKISGLDDSCVRLSFGISSSWCKIGSSSSCCRNPRISNCRLGILLMLLTSPALVLIVLSWLDGICMMVPRSSMMMNALRLLKYGNFLGS